MKYFISIIICCLICCFSTSFAFASNATPQDKIEYLENRIKILELQYDKLQGEMEKLQYDLSMSKKMTARADRNDSSRNYATSHSSLNPNLESRTTGNIRNIEPPRYAPTMQDRQQNDIKPIREVVAAQILQKDDADIFDQMDIQDIKTSQETDNQKEYNKARALLKSGKYSLAQKAFEELLKKNPSDSIIAKTYYWLAETFFRRNQFKKAAIYYLRCYKEFPQDRKAPDSLLQLALSLSAIGKKNDACIMLTKLEEEFPNRSSYSIKLASDSQIKFGCIEEINDKDNN